MSAPWIAAFIVLSAVVAVLCIIVVGLLRRVQDVLVSAERVLSAHEDSGPGGLKVGATVPAFDVVDDSGNVITHDPADASELGDVLYLLVDPGCGPCRDLVGELAGLNEFDSRLADLVVLARDTGNSNRWLTGVHARTFAHTGTADAAFDAHATPYAFAVRDGKVVTRDHPNSVDSLFSLLDKNQAAPIRADN